MQSLFSASPFGNPGNPVFMMAGPPQRPRQMGRPYLGGFIDDITQAIPALLEKLPPELLGKYKAEYQKCLDMMDSPVGLIPGGKCLSDLYHELRDIIKGEGGDPGPVPTPTPEPKPEPAGFPYVPVAIAAGGAGLLIFLVMSLKK